MVLVRGSASVGQIGDTGMNSIINLMQIGRYLVEGMPKGNESHVDWSKGERGCFPTRSKWFRLPKRNESHVDWSE